MTSMQGAGVQLIGGRVCSLALSATRCALVRVHWAQTGRGTSLRLALGDACFGSIQEVARAELLRVQTIDRLAGTELE